MLALPLNKLQGLIYGELLDQRPGRNRIGTSRKGERATLLRFVSLFQQPPGGARHAEEGAKKRAFGLGFVSNAADANCARVLRRATYRI